MRALLILLLAASSALGSPPRVAVRVDDGHLVARFAVENGGEACATAQLLDLQDVVVARGEVRSAADGEGTLALVLDFAPGRLSFAEESLLSWYRLRYKAGACGASEEPRIVSLSQVLKDAFELRARGAEYSIGKTRSVWVQASRAGGAPLAGVEIEVLRGQARTHAISAADGTAILTFEIPERGVLDSEELKVIGRYEGLRRALSFPISDGWAPSLLLSTDKAIYQPGQVLHARVVLMDALRAALEQREALLSVRGPDGTTVFRKELVTSRFGVAAGDWAIPGDAPSGEYSVTVGAKGSSADSGWSGLSVEVHPYELPTFTVAVKPAKGYSMNGEKAEVEVTATYLSGQPMTKFTSRIVAEDRRWDRAEPSESKAVAEGVAPIGGIFKAAIDVPAFTETRWRHFTDTPFVAYVTDPSTGHTEHRRFELRSTRDPIHVYSIGREPAGGVLPSTLYVTTFYADGTPAACDVEVSIDATPIATLQTNRFGIGKVIAKVPAGKNLHLVARDARGAKGEWVEDLWRRDESDHVRLVLEKAIHRSGEPIEAEIEAPFEEGTVLVDVARGSELLVGLSVPIVKGRGRVTIPFRPEFVGAVSVVAYPSETRVGARLSEAASFQAVLFPDDRELTLSARLSKKSYQPGASAFARFTLRTRGGAPVAGALGVTVVDRAVEERASESWYGGRGMDPFTGPFKTLVEGDEELAGFHLADFLRLDPTKAVPPDVELVAEAMLNREQLYFPELVSSRTAPSFAALFDRSLRALDAMLAKRPGSLPRTEAELVLGMAATSSPWPILDPWGTPYRFEFGVEGAYDTLSIFSAGPDQAQRTQDDVKVRFAHVSSLQAEEDALLRALTRFHARTGSHVTALAPLVEELRRDGVEMESWRDRKGRPVDVSVHALRNTIAADVTSGDGTLLARARLDFAQELIASVREAAELHLRRTGCPSENEEELRLALVSSGLGPILRDPFGSVWRTQFGIERGIPLTATFEEGGRHFVRKSVHDRVSLGLYSAGDDGVEGTADDYGAGRIVLDLPRSERIVEIDNSAATTVTTTAPIPAPTRAAVASVEAAPPERGISGAVVDENGAPLPGVEVVCWGLDSGERRNTVSDSAGRYSFADLSDGSYSVRFHLSGFVDLTLANVLLSADRAFTRMNAALKLDGVKSEVVVTGEAPAVETHSNAVGSGTRAEKELATFRARPRPMQTPRLREFFPETLAWEPLLVTGRDGRARLDFKLADNITTWTLFAVASNEKGQLGFARTDFNAFQPFFLEHEPPKILTIGDEISLPVVIRNYRQRDQETELVMAEASWFRLLDGSRREVTVPKSDSKTQTFRFRAEQALAGGKQRVTARGLGAPNESPVGDAVEKLVSVHRNAEERFVSQGAIVRGSVRLLCEAPAQALPGSLRARLTIYPSLTAQLTESLEAILQRPYGCAEQTISSTYPSVLMLRHLKESGLKSPELEKRVHAYAIAGVEKLKSFRESSGGFSYFGTGATDSSLTAYALAFLLEAERFVPVEDALVVKAAESLANSQGADGAWSSSQWRSRKLVEAALIARALLNARHRTPLALPAARRALAYLQTFLKDSSALGAGEEAYFLAAYALAAEEGAETEKVETALARLRSLAEPVRGGLFWRSGQGSPFFGWGRAGDLEATALAAQALLKGKGSDRTQADQALLYLLREKDRYGVWLSGHATVNVLEGLMLVASAPSSPNGGSLMLCMNGKAAGRVEIASGGGDLNPIEVDLSAFVSTGSNDMSIDASEGVDAIARIGLSYEIPWSTPSPSSDVAYDVSFDRTEARAGMEITASVVARRTSANGGGMLLAEVGIPPGAEVDRASLTDLVNGFKSGVYRYEVQPDRVVFYVWPIWGMGDAASRFSFRFRPRYPIKALTAPSSLTDYYNPDAHVTLPPTRFVVR